MRKNIATETDLTIFFNAVLDQDSSFGESMKRALRTIRGKVAFGSEVALTHAVLDSCGSEKIAAE